MCVIFKAQYNNHNIASYNIPMYIVMYVLLLAMYIHVKKSYYVVTYIASYVATMQTSIVIVGMHSWIYYLGDL